MLNDINGKLEASNNLVLVAEPGAGKSTAVPLSLLSTPWLNEKAIIMLQPRRIAAKSIAQFLATLLGEKVGETVGYQVRNDSKVSQLTRLYIVTEGILTRRIQDDPELTEVGLVIFDEFHEGSLSSELGIMLATEIQQALREDLRLLVMSATMDTQPLLKYLPQSSAVACEGRSYPISVNYFPSKLRLEEHVTQAIHMALKADSTGDILVFLPGQGQINHCINRFKDSLQNKDTLNNNNALKENASFDLTKIKLLPLYGSLELSQQQEALVPALDGNRKVIFSTNVAETSLTVQGVTTVIDSGLEKRMMFDPKSGLHKLMTGWIAKSSATQRAGRAGRMGPGSCIKLYSESQEKSFVDFQPPEIMTAELLDFVLQLNAWGNLTYQETPWLNAPPEAHYNQAKTQLARLGFLESSGTLSELGKAAMAIPVTPRVAKIILSNRANLLQSCCVAALLELRDIFSHSESVDFSERVSTLLEFVNGSLNLQIKSLHKSVLHQAKLQVNALLKHVQKLTNFRHEYESLSLAESLLIGFPERLAKKRQGDDKRFQMANGRGVTLRDHDPLCGTEWLVIVDCDIADRDGRVYSAVAISKPEIIKVLSEHVVIEEEFAEDKQQRLTLKKSTKFMSLEIDTATTYDIDNEHKRRYVLQTLKRRGLEALKWTDNCEQWLQRATWLGEHVEHFENISRANIENNFETWLFPYLPNKLDSVKDLKTIDIYPLLMSLLNWDQQQFFEKEAPEHYTAPSGKRVPIQYHPQQGPMVSLQLQEVFGELESPKLAENRVALGFELLSPARRPIQTTSDLAGFWQRSYHEVAKEMRGRYPKHRWPEDPMIERAGRSLKKK